MTITGQGDDQGQAAAVLDGLPAGVVGAAEEVPSEFATAPVGASYDFVATAAPPATGALDIAALTAGSKWTSVDPASGRTIVTYSFADPHTSQFSYTDFPATLSTFSPADRALTRAILANIEATCNVHFVEVPDDANICGVVRYGYSQQLAAMQLAGYAFYPSTDPRGGDVWIASDIANARWDGFRPDLILHETLHALGLKHPFESGAVLPTADNIIPTTVMSYSPVAGSTTGNMSAYPTEPMPLDIATLQFLYGQAQTAPEDTRYDLASPAFQNDFATIDDSGGHDVLDASGLARGVSLNLNEDARSDVGVRVTASGTVNGTLVTTTYTSTLAIAPGTIIEDAIGTDQADTIIGNAAANRLDGRGGNDQLFGGDGNDVLVGGPGDDVIDGGSGVNEADYSGARGDYTITRSGAALVVADGAPDRDGTDTLTNVQRLKFADGWLALDTAGDAGQAYRLYQAAFARTPDAAGLGFWTHALDAGVPLHDVAQTFVTSAEFAIRYGAPANTQFVTQLYANVLHRAPDPGGLAFHTGNLDAGAIDRAGLLAQFSESAENQAALIAAIQDGMFFTG